MKTKNIFITALLLVLVVFAVGQTKVKASSSNNVFGSGGGEN
jgi:regulatory protein YycI of two-component signal transduction system YycFG